MRKNREYAERLKELEKLIEKFLDRMLDVSNLSVVKRFELKIYELERQRLILAEKYSR